MDPGHVFARHFAQLVWLIREDRGDIDGQKGALRGMVAALAASRVVLDVGVDDALSANGEPVTDVSGCMTTLVEQMTALDVTTITVDASARPGALLEAARRLVDPTFAAGGAASITTAGVMLSKRQRALSPAPVVAPAHAYGSPPTTIVAAPMPAARSAPAMGMGDPSGLVTGAVSMYDQYLALSPSVMGKVERLLEQLEADPEGEPLLSVLSKLTTVAERASNEGKMPLAVRVVSALAVRERRLAHPRARRSFELALFRLAQPAMLRAIAERLPKAGDDRPGLVAALARAGEEGADAVIEQLALATERSYRRVYFDTLVQLKCGVSTLLHMLGDARWYVVRNAAELLGELRVREAEAPLCELLRHPEERVRRSVCVALARVGGGKGMQGVIAALGDSAADVRIQAGAALASRPSGTVSSALLAALDAERDERVQAAHLLSLGRLGDAEAVDRLVGYAWPRRGVFRPNSALLRLAAIDGLAKARTTIAMRTLAELASDDDPAVRAAVTAALSRSTAPAAQGV